MGEPDDTRLARNSPARPVAGRTGPPAGCLWRRRRTWLLRSNENFSSRGDTWRSAVTQSTSIRQGYVVRSKRSSVRIRISAHGAWVTIKAGMKPLKRSEFEYPVPREDAESLLGFCRLPIIEKTRHIVPWRGDLSWEIDEFQGVLQGVIVAEIEVPHADTEFAKPVWIGPEVTFDPRYLNVNIHCLAVAPLKRAANLNHLAPRRTYGEHLPLANRPEI